MSKLKFQIYSPQGEVTSTTFRNAIDRAVSLLREFDGAISRKRNGTLIWYVQGLHSNGSFSVDFASRLNLAAQHAGLPDISPRVTNNLLTGFTDLEEKGEQPSYLSEFGLRTAGNLANLTRRGTGATEIRFSTDDRQVVVTPKTSETVHRLLPIKRTAIGSVEGMLEEINIHRRAGSKDAKFKSAVYHSVTNKAITCLFNDQQMDEVKNALGKRVLVFGQLQKNIAGNTLRVEMDHLEILENKKRFTLPDMGELESPDFENAQSTEEYMRTIRGG
jgi:hypothetical protein